MIPIYFLLLRGVLFFTTKNIFLCINIYKYFPFWSVTLLLCYINPSYSSKITLIFNFAECYYTFFYTFTYSNCFIDVLCIMLGKVCKLP